MTLGLILILSIFGMTTAENESWQCRNDLEIRCSSGKCEAETGDGFTPMSVSFDDSGKMSVCAYTGCWEGKGKVFKSKNFISLNGHNLKFSTSQNSADMNENISILLDRNDNIALLKAGSFAQPLLCEKKTAEKSKKQSAVFKQIEKSLQSRKRFGNLS